MKRRKVRDEADATRYIRAGLRRTLAEWLADWRPVWVRHSYGGADRYRIERLYSGDLGGTAEDQGVQFSLADVPAECRPLVATLIDLLDEQAAMARVAVNVAQGELETHAWRTAGAAKGGAAQKREAAKRDAKIEVAAKQIRKTDPHIKKEALAATLADRDDVIGTRATIRKKITRPPAEKKSREER